MMATLAVCCGFVLNQVRPRPLPLVYVSKAERVAQAAERIAREMQTMPGSFDASEGEGVSEEKFHMLDLAAFVEMRKEFPDALLLDARPEVFHRLGHIPQALSLPCDEFEDFYKAQRDILEKSKSRPVLVYCSGGSCDDGKMVAGALVRLGFTQVYLFKGGWDAWTQAKLPEEKGR